MELPSLPCHPSVPAPVAPRVPPRALRKPTVLRGLPGVVVGAACRWRCRRALEADKSDKSCLVLGVERRFSWIFMDFHGFSWMFEWFR